MIGKSELREQLVQRPDRVVRSGRRSAFSLIELLVVISVAVILTGLMLPAMSSVREDARSIICASNQRQLAMAIFMYAREHQDELPYSEPLRWDPAAPQELMAAHHGDGRVEWDSLGLLFQWHYCEQGEVFYCPSHDGEHPFERYAASWQHPSGPTPPEFLETVYTNFHYCGDVEWESGQRRRLVDSNRLVLITDGLRTLSDFNHDYGLNAVHGDGSVRWHEDGLGVRRILPEGEIDDPAAQIQYSRLWDAIEWWVN